MVNISLIYLIKEKSESTFNELKSLYDSLTKYTNSFELIVVNSSSDDVFNSDLNIFCGNRQYCKYKCLVGKTFKVLLKSTLSMTEYEDIILLNSDLVYHAIDLDYILVNYSAFKSSVCFSLYENNNSKQREISGVVLKHKDLILALKYTNAKSFTEFCMQCCMLYYYIGDVYRINYRTSYFKLVRSSIRFTGLERLRLSIFLTRCKFAYENRFNLHK